MRGDDEFVQQIKSDGSFLRQILGVERDGQHCKCPWCNDTCMRVGPDKRGNGIYLFQCMKDCAQGTVIDAIMKLENKSFSDVMADLRKQHGVQRAAAGASKEREKITPQEREEQDRPDPVIDMEKALEFVNWAHETLCTREDLQAKWLTKRNITLDVCRRYRVGFLDEFVIDIPGRDGGQDRPWRVNNGWVLPITDNLGVLRAVKIHFETPPPGFKGKSVWMPFGTEPKHDRVKNIIPVNAYYSFWPPLEQQTREQQEVGTDYTWWLNRAPEAMQDEWRKAFEFEKLSRAADLSVSVDELSMADVESAAQTIFSQMRGKIQREVLRASAQARGEKFDGGNYDYAVVPPGELKALADISAGEIATSVTGGEGALPTERHFGVFRGRNVLLKYDDDIAKLARPDDPKSKILCAGRAFVHKMVPMLTKFKAREIRIATHGRRSIRAAQDQFEAVST